MDIHEKPTTVYCAIWIAYARPYISSPFPTEKAAQAHIDKNIRPQEKDYYKECQVLPVQLPFSKLQMADMFV